MFQAGWEGQQNKLFALLIALHTVYVLGQNTPFFSKGRGGQSKYPVF